MIDAATIFPGRAKTCPGCGYIKPLSSFSTNRTKGDGVQSRCKLCNATRTRRIAQAEHEREAVTPEPQPPAPVTPYRYTPVSGGLLLAGYVR